MSRLASLRFSSTICNILSFAAFSFWSLVYWKTASFFTGRCLILTSCLYIFSFSIEILSWVSGDLTLTVGLGVQRKRTNCRPGVAERFNLGFLGVYGLQGLDVVIIAANDVTGRWKRWGRCTCTSNSWDYLKYLNLKLRIRSPNLMGQKSKTQTYVNSSKFSKSKSRN